MSETIAATAQQRTQPVQDSAQPIFVLGAAAGGRHALIGAMLGQHPACFGMPELNLLVGDNLEEVAFRLNQPHNAQFHGLLRAAAYLLSGEQSMDAVAMARRWMIRRMSLPTWRIFEELRVKVAPRRMVDPSRAYSLKLDALKVIQRSYPGASVVRLVAPAAERGGRESAGGQKRQGALARFFEALPDGQLAELSVEGFEQAPRTTLRKLCAALALPCDDAALDAMMQPQNSPFAGLGPAGANLGNDPAFLANPAFRSPLERRSA
ncbi:sulfotransferase [Ancylobacter sp. MQZ15Z-1]|uniref:Sulfotransferase n=1 Tax=Ancylobacter mangrovi TaxID=2972472 RepID=A0A9X2PDH3_9HYPH|nr:sulfotransferase [Ancylobacter mangrovi]MCS0494088.1 sulfotransferase [Ancylobacter mangrovi]